MIRPTKEEIQVILDQLKKTWPIAELKLRANIDALEKERDEWKFITEFDCTTCDQLREALDQASVTLGYLNRCGIEHAGKAHDKIREILGEQDVAQAATPEYPCAGCGGEGKQREGKFFYSCDKCNSSSARDSNG